LSTSDALSAAAETSICSALEVVGQCR
jgi:hypothetical protein